MRSIGTFANAVTTKRSFNDTIQRATELLAQEGFGILADMDVQATLKKKLNLVTKPYRILGACNPQFAHQALEAEPHIGVLLPCNLVVWDEGDHRVVVAMEPKVMSGIVDHPVVHQVADQVSERLRHVLDKIG